MIEKMDNDCLMSSSEVAKDYGKTARWLNELLEELNVLKMNNLGCWVISEEYEKAGYVRYVLPTYADKSKTNMWHLYWTFNGKYFIYNLLKVNGIVPLDETEEE